MAFIRLLRTEVFSFIFVRDMIENIQKFFREKNRLDKSLERRPILDPTLYYKEHH